MVLFQSWHDILRGESWMPCLLVFAAGLGMLIITALEQQNGFLVSSVVLLAGTYFTFTTGHIVGL